MIQRHTANLSPQLKAEVFDFILFIEQKQSNSASKKKTQSKHLLKQALDDAVSLEIFTGIDGVKWQKEQRQDKKLFGRDS